MGTEVTLNLNGIKASGRPGTTILEVARQNGITIPTLCYLEGFPPMGACRLCVVEVEGSRTLVASCHTPIAEGMVIQTHSPKVVEARRVMVELLLASHPDNCLICDKANICELRKIAADLEIGLPRFHARKHYYPMETENTYLLRDMAKCIQCRRCVVACKNVKGQSLFSMAYRGFESKVIFGNDEPLPSGDVCRDCDVCASVCPSEALMKPWKPHEGRAKKALYIKG